jgi:hypothetical protein
VLGRAGSCGQGLREALRVAIDANDRACKATAVVLFATCAVLGFETVLSAAPEPSRLHAQAQSVCVLLLRRWSNKLAFNRRDKRDDDQRAINERKDQDRRKRADIRERLAEQDREVLQEYKRRLGRVDWDRIDREFAAPADATTGSRANDEAGADTEAERVEDAEAYYWGDQS